ncbi:MAG: hypothetical protein ACOCVQ_00420 [Bacillota bacterium]
MRRFLGGLLILVAGFFSFPPIALADPLDGLTSIIGRSFYEVFRPFGWFGVSALQIIGVVSLVIRLAAYALIVLAIILFLRDRRVTTPEDDRVCEGERVSPERDDSGEDTTEATTAAVDASVREREQMDRLRERIDDLERRLIELEGHSDNHP